MKGVVLAGGFGRRLFPLTRITNKHLLPVYDRPMIYYAIQQLAGAGIDRIMVVTGGTSAGDFLRLLGNGAEFGLKHLDYAYQEDAGGIAQALGLAKHFVGSDPVVVMLGDNIFEHTIAPVVERFRAQPHGARIVLAQVPNPSAYGVAVFEGDRLVRIEEKPETPASDLVVTGVYMYDNGVFDVLRSLVPSGRGELEITDVNNEYLRRGVLAHDRMPGYWADCGESFAKLLEANNLVARFSANKPWPPG